MPVQKKVWKLIECPLYPLSKLALTKILSHPSIHTHTHIHIYIYICVCVCVCVYIYICILGYYKILKILVSASLQSGYHVTEVKPCNIHAVVDSTVVVGALTRCALLHFFCS